MAERAFYADPEWWMEQALVWVVFSVAISVLLTLGQWWLERRRRAPYENWHLAVWGFDPPDAKDDQLQELHWEEVMRMEQSAFERWKTVKSAVSGHTQIKLSRIERAERNPDKPEDVWSMFDRKNRRLIVDLNRIPEGQRGPYAKGSVPWPSPVWGHHQEPAPAAAPSDPPHDPEQAGPVPEGEPVRH